MAPRVPATLTGRAAAVAALGAVLAAGCGSDEIAAADPVAGLADPEVVGAVLAHCHAGLLGMEQVAARVTLPDGTELQVLAHLPDRARVQFPDGAIHVANRDRVGRRIADQEVPAALSPEATLRLRAVMALVDAAALGPLHRSIGCSRAPQAAGGEPGLEPRTWVLAQPAGEAVEMTLAPHSLLVERLHGPPGTVQIEEHLRTTTTSIVAAASIAALGRCRVRFDSIDCAWPDTMFDAAPPTSSAAPVGNAALTLGTPSRPTTPTIEAVRAARWLIVEDPVDWSARAELVQSRMRALGANGQVTAGFAGLLQDGERARLVIPFRAQPDQPEFAPPADWEVRDLPAGRALVVFPPAGDLAQRRAEGERLLRQALADRQLTAIGPVLAQPYLHLDEAAPDAAAVAAPMVRVSVPIR